MEQRIMLGLNRVWREFRQNRKIFMGYFSMILIPLLVAIALFVSIHTLMIRQLENFGETKAQYFEAQVTSLFQEIELITDSIATDSAISRSLSQPDTPTSEGIRLCGDLRAYAGRSSFISEIYVICQDRDYILTSLGLYTARSLDEILAKIGETRQSFSEVAGEEDNPGWHIGSRGIVEPYYVAPLYGATASQKAGDIVIVMNTTVLYNTLSGENVALCCLFDENRYISSIGSGSNNIDWYSDPGISRLLSTDVKCFFTNSDNFTYMVAIPTASFYAPSRVIVMCFLLFFVIVAGIGVVQAIRTSRRNVREISRIIGKLPVTPPSNPTYADLTSEIEQALIRYRDNVDRLDLELKSNNSRWILEGSLTQPLSVELLAGAGISASCAGYHVAAFSIDDYSDMFFDTRSETENRNVALVILRSVLSTVATGRAEVACSRVGSDFAVVFCHDFEDALDQTVTAIIQETVDLLEQNYGLNIRVALSGWIDTPSGLSRAYSQVREISLFAHSVDIDTGFISHRGLMGGGEAIADFRYIKQIQILVNTLLLGKYEIIPQLVRTLLDTEVAGSAGNYALVKSRIAAVAELLSEAVMSCEEQGIDRAGCALRLRTADSVSKLNETAEDIFGELDRVSADSPTKANLVDRACQYIRKHVSDPCMDIPNICEAVDVSPQHLSRLFRRLLDKTVSEYINECRINYAKELLLDRKLTISRITQAVGYGSNDTLYRNFKKIAGVTPMEYARLISDSEKM